MTAIEIRPRGPFSLAAAQSFPLGFPAGIGVGGVGTDSITLVASRTASPRATRWARN